MGEVVLGVLPGVEDDGHVAGAGRDPGRGGDRLVLAEQLAGHRGELGDVGPVTGVGVPGQRYPAVPGDHQAQAHQPKVGALLLGLAPLRDRRLAVRGADERREIGHVQRHRRAVHPGCLNDPHRDRAADCFQLFQGDGVHRFPEPPVIQGAGRDLGEPVRGGGLPPVRERRLGTRRNEPVQRRQRQVGARGQRRPGRAGAGHLVDDRGDPQVLQHSPGRGHVPERQVPGPLRQRSRLGAFHRRGDVGGGAQVAFGDHLRPAVDAGHLAQVPVRLPADLLRVQARHDIRSYTRISKKSNTQPACHQGKPVKPATGPASENHDHLKLRLGGGKGIASGPCPT